MTTAPGTTRRGGDWLIGDSADASIFTREQLSEEHRLVGQTAAEFVANEVVPALEKLEAKDWPAARALVRRAGDLGLIGVDTPDALGGVGLDKVASIVVGEAVGGASSFATTFGAQTGLAIIPIICFGTKDQQRRYLPGLLSGERIGAYCLSESGSGSDALAARTRATRAPDGSWILSGEKMWITNGAFADVFIVFAKVDGDQFTAFIVERGFAGVASGKEEHKMGLHGSSTTPLVLTEAHVPAANLLGEIGRGHKIAFNVLNYGRFKLGAMCTGGAKAAMAEAVVYAASRRQFGEPLTGFGAIQHKLGEMAIRIYAVESMLYRTAGLIDAAIGDQGDDPGAVAAALEEFALESSLLKVAGSEMIDFVIDEEVQIHGGNGFVNDYPAERRYRDARVNRIFEGTNEINRLLVPALLVKRAMKGGPPALEAAARIATDPAAATARAAADTSDTLGVARRTAESLKHAALVMLGAAVTRHGDALVQEQEVVMLIADVVMDAYAGESAVLRASQAASVGYGSANAQADAAAVFVADAADRALTRARTAATALTRGPERTQALALIDRILLPHGLDTIAARRRVASAAIEKRRYPFI